MMKRKIMSLLKTWLEKKDRQSLIVEGARQVGKT
jgi:predicted AAA+ superfamily ATPase